MISLLVTLPGWASACGLSKDLRWVFQRRGCKITKEEIKFCPTMWYRQCPAYFCIYMLLMLYVGFDGWASQEAVRTILRDVFLLKWTYHCRTATIVNIVCFVWRMALFGKAGDHVHVLHGKIGGNSSFQDVGVYLSMGFPFARVKPDLTHYKQGLQ